MRDIRKMTNFEFGITGIMSSRLHIAIPIMDELKNLPSLLADISQQTIDNYIVYFCVNQPDKWWADPDRSRVCEANQESISYLNAKAGFPVKIIDSSSKGKGWKGKNHGVGWARKLAMDAAIGEAGPDDIIITLDADTNFSKNYFLSVQENLNVHPKAAGLSVPYYHRLTDREAENRSILRYEIYMRNYAINLWRIDNPYCFTALGSAMAVPVKSYKAIGGMTPKRSGEDFYFLQKLRKYGELLTWNEEKVYPAARFSDRVFFGTGPAMIKGAAGDWNSYPVYHHSLFEHIRETYQAFENLYLRDIPTPMDVFIREQLKQHNIWEPLRANSSNPKQFLRACRDKIDGLRILQFLKYMQPDIGRTDEECLSDFFMLYHPEELNKLKFLRGSYKFDALDTAELDALRNSLAAIEEEYQKKSHQG
jgi:hypothetical protein